MDKADDAAAPVPCPFCAEPIRPDAIICRFCRSNLVDAGGRRISSSEATKRQAEAASQPPLGAPGSSTPTVSLWSALGANLLLPGLGSWRMGHRLRGAVLLLLILLCFSQHLNTSLAVIRKEMPRALKTGQTKALETHLAEAGDDGWGTAAFWLYIYSFADVLLLSYRKQG